MMRAAFEPATRRRTSMRDDPAVIALVTAAREGDQRAWDEIVERYAPLVWAICRRYQLNRSDTDDVAQTLWLLLVEQLGKLRQPAALPGWIATTTARECLRVIRTASRYDHTELTSDSQLDRDSSPQIEQEVLAAELYAAVRAAFAELPDHCRKLLSMLISDPPVSYAEISATLSIKIGGIGPQRARCLDRLRRSSSLSAFIDSERADQ
jgi:RNA polymerase sigma factor (sigma-70 family)